MPRQQAAFLKTSTSISAAQVHVTTMSIRRGDIIERTTRKNISARHVKPSIWLAGIFEIPESGGHRIAPSK
ncbi:hypothetical protein CO661_06190 [Sinorhizobium fredii]|uniref:Uncharacterized protein n=1 Tax=Rhizobium fredii TaxID=380 RepID=A0A2A6M3I9_RHIFR|nr:hypothetical protein [Sinorhizobium fredii]MQX08605.1 hypothetical protein [Sinorhizobium fredii]PDT49433.1 hypothetical protein CO661_06190 [Sinorhizobium fredii]UTY49629.1 hypothetical protein EPK84_24130 [Sinorhizobium fredii]